MKKFFLIPLMTLFSCVMAWATDAHVSNITDLKAAVADASVETIYLEDDIAYTSETVGSQINICRSLTLDGQGHTLKGCAKRTSSGNYNVLSINHNGSQMVDVTIKNITLTGKYNKDHKANKPVETRGNIHSLTLIDVVIDNQDGPSGNNQGLTIGGAQGTTADITLTRTQILMNSSSYPVVVFNPINLTMTDSKTLGYCSLFFKPDTYGGNNSTVVATNCDLDAPNPHSYTGGFNSFGLFVMQYGINGVNITLNNCGMNAQVTGNSAQGMFVSQGDNNLTITGDNSHINGEFVISNEYKSRWLAYAAGHITITGGTYAQDPSNIGTVQCYTFDEYDNIVVDGDNNPVLVPCEVNCVPEGYEVKEITMEGVATPLYRVVKKAARDGEDKLYDLNDNVQSQGDGQNPTTSFELSDGSPMILNQETTKAGYVEVSNGTTVTVATDQTLVINNGLDVQGTSVVTANPGSALVIGEGGIVTKSSSSIVVEANQNGAASLLLDPTITVNQTPELTVKMTVPAEHAGYEMLGSDQYRHWHRFAMPVDHMAATWAKEPNVPTYLYGWDYSAQEWAQVGVTEMVPFAGYTLSPDKEISTNTAVTYTFKGKLLGNTNCTLNLNHHGYNFFGNSYTGYISILKLVDQIMGDAKIDGTVWMWNGEKYEGIGLEYLRQYENVPGMIEPWQKEVAPMQTFVLRLTGSEFSSTDINYADAIWGNPRYDNAKSALNAAPARRAEINDDAIIRMTIEANGQKESVVLIENGVYSDAYDRGYDAIKYMNENCFNTYVSVNGENYGTVATDNLEGKMLNIKTNNELAYSMTFDFVAGEEYALRDNLTGKVIAIEEGATYEFAAQPNSTIEGRFEIVSVAKMPTAIENTEVKANVKGIYTLTGQYVGENFEALPAGVYVVNGVKIVK